MVLTLLPTATLVVGNPALAATQPPGAAAPGSPAPSASGDLPLVPQPPPPVIQSKPWFTYTVQAGDNLWDIALRFNIDLPTIEYANGLDNYSILQPGQKLKILLHVGWIYHVQPDDTLSSVAAANGVSLAGLESANDIHGDVSIAPGTELIIPRDPTVKLVAPPPPLAQTPTMSTLAEDVASAAESLIGDPYVWGGAGPYVFDCSGLVQYVYRLVTGFELPHASQLQFFYGQPVPEGNLLPGDLVFFNTDGAGASHVGIYIGGPDHDFVSAETPALGVGVGSLEMPYWADHYVGARRLLTG